MTIYLDTVEIEEAIWSDEFEWSDAKAVFKRTLGGRAIVHTNVIQSSAGRPITIGGENCWVTRESLLILHSWIQEPDKRMTLTLEDLRVFQVGFRLWDSPVITAAPIFPVANPSNDFYYILNPLKLAIL